MDKKMRRLHREADSSWDIPAGKKPGAVDANHVGRIVLMDLRAVLHDQLDEMKETNRLLRVAFGIEREGDK